MIGLDSVISTYEHLFYFLKMQPPKMYIYNIYFIFYFLLFRYFYPKMVILLSHFDENITFVCGIFQANSYYLVV